MGATFSRRLGSICTDFSTKGTKYAGNDDAIARYDALWDEWRTLKAAHTCCPTLYKGEAGFFGNPTGINHMVDRYRK